MRGKQFLDVDPPPALHELDLSRAPNCHVCGQSLQRNSTTALEWCINPRCQVRGLRFNIPCKMGRRINRRAR